MDILSSQFIEYGSAGIVLALFIGTFVSEDLACITAGSLIAADRIDPYSAVLACLAGIVVGDLLLFGAGRIFGQQILTSRLAARFVAPAAVDRASEWLSARGTSAIFISRFVSGLRLPTYFLSGALHLDPKRFALLVTIGAAIWTPTIVLAAAFWQTTIPLSAVSAVIAFFVIFQFAFRLTDRRRRRILAGRLKRIWNWEFWPLWVFYIPVVLYIAYLAIRHRGLHFTAANPGMPASGFVGESKDAIYRLIAKAQGSPDHLLRHIRLSRADVCEANDFMAANQLTFPIIVKPDSGERGNGVKIVRDGLELEAVIAEIRTPFLVQEYVDGVEVSVFYYRMPNEARGRIFSVTEKIFPTVIGDGVSTLEELILSDARAHIIAESYFKRNRDRLRSVPKEGESVSLVDIGSHSKGAIFRDGERLKTDDLERSIDSLASSIPGFYFGRFDLRAAGFDEFRAGRFRIIELNGVTSESTNIYDPQHTLVDAYRILFAQWKLAFEIGAKNGASGSHRSTIPHLISLYIRSKRLA